MQAPFFVGSFLGIPLQSLFLLALFLGGALLISAAVYGLFRSRLARYCHRDTTGIALALSAVGGAGGMCLTGWFFSAAWGTYRYQPVVHAGYIVGGFLALTVCVVLCVLYVRRRRQRFSLPGILLDAGMVVLYLPGTYTLWSCLLIAFLPLLDGLYTP